MADEPVFIELEEPGVNKQGTDVNIKEVPGNSKDGFDVDFGDEETTKKQGTTVNVISLENPKTI